MNQTISNTLRLLVLLATIGVFGYYLKHHPELVYQFARTQPHVIVLLLILYLVWFGALGLTVHATLRICRCPLLLSEYLLLNAYSTLVNFFVPGQGGVAVRGLYLKKRHHLGIQKYVLVTLMYYMNYAIISAFMLLASSQPWWKTLLGVMFVLFGSIAVVHLYERRLGTRVGVLDMRLVNFGFLLLATLMVVTSQVAIYFYELRTIQPAVSLQQAITYTGAANFSVFVALTPGAIGIRESFLFFSEKLHHVDISTVLAASILDRTVFLIFLLLLFIFSHVAHVKKSLGL